MRYCLIGVALLIKKLVHFQGHCKVKCFVNIEYCVLDRWKNTPDLAVLFKDDSFKILSLRCSIINKEVSSFSWSCLLFTWPNSASVITKTRDRQCNNDDTWLCNHDFNSLLIWFPSYGVCKICRIPSNTSQNNNNLFLSLTLIDIWTSFDEEFILNRYHSVYAWKCYYSRPIKFTIK